MRSLDQSSRERPTHLCIPLASNSRRHLTTNENKSAAIVITRPPEIITCVKISIPGDADVFMVFDSHSRPDHPDGAGFIFSTSIDVTALYLDNLLAIDESILSDRSLQWQTQLLANFSGLLFVAKTIRFDQDPIEAERAMIESSLAILALQAEVTDLKSQNAALQRDLRDAEYRLEEERLNSYRSSTSPKSSKKYSEPAWTPAPTRKKHRKKKGDKSSSGPTDYRPSVFSPYHRPSTHLRTNSQVLQLQSSTLAANHSGMIGPHYHRVSPTRPLVRMSHRRVLHRPHHALRPLPPHSTMMP